MVLRPLISLLPSFLPPHLTLPYLVSTRPILHRLASPSFAPSSFVAPRFSSSRPFRPLRFAGCAFSVTNSSVSLHLPPIHLLVSSRVLTLPRLNISTGILLRLRFTLIRCGVGARAHGERGSLCNLRFRQDIDLRNTTRRVLGVIVCETIEVLSPRTLNKFNAIRAAPIAICPLFLAREYPEPAVLIRIASIDSSCRIFSANCISICFHPSSNYLLYINANRPHYSSV